MASQNSGCGGADAVTGGSRFWEATSSLELTRPLRSSTSCENGAMGLIPSPWVAISILDRRFECSICCCSNCFIWANRPPLPRPVRSERRVPAISGSCFSEPRHGDNRHTWRCLDGRSRSFCHVLVVVTVVTIVNNFALGRHRAKMGRTRTSASCFQSFSAPTSDGWMSMFKTAFRNVDRRLDACFST